MKASQTDDDTNDHNQHVQRRARQQRVGVGGIAGVHGGRNVVANCFDRLCRRRRRVAAVVVCRINVKVFGHRCESASVCMCILMR